MSGDPVCPGGQCLCPCCHRPVRERPAHSPQGGGKYRRAAAVAAELIGGYLERTGRLPPYKWLAGQMQIPISTAGDHVRRHRALTAPDSGSSTKV